MANEKILIIEDDDDIRNGLQDLLEESGYKIYICNDGKNGLELAKEILPDLILCDIMMPKMNGYEVKTNLESALKTKTIPFIFLTAKAEINDLRYGMEIGADDYITKPYKTKDLLKSIENRLNKKKAIEENSIPQKEIHQNSKSENEISEKKLGEEDNLWISINGKPAFVKVKDIICITAESEYSFLFTKNPGKILVRKLLKDWEEILPEKIFLRIHRSTIINLNCIEKIEKWFQRSYKVKLKNHDEEFIISQRYASKLKSVFKI